MVSERAGHERQARRMLIRRAELFLFSSDYPHPEGTDDPIGRFERTFNGITEEQKEKFYSSNFQAMMGLSP